MTKRKSAEAQRLANKARAAVERGVVPGSEEALAEAGAWAARVLAGSEKDEIRALATALFDSRNGYAEPVGTFSDGVWSPDPAQYVVKAQELTAALAADVADGGHFFRAKMLCKSWPYCWALAEAWLTNKTPAANFPPYVAEAYRRVNLPKIREKAAERAALAAEKLARGIAEAHTEKLANVPEVKREARRTKRAAVLACQIAGLEESIARHTKAIKACKTRLRGALRSQKAAARRAAKP